MLTNESMYLWKPLSLPPEVRLGFQIPSLEANALGINKKKCMTGKKKSHLQNV